MTPHPTTRKAGWWEHAWGRRLRLLMVAGLWLGAALAQAALEDEVRAYEAQDAISPPAAGAIVFVGSSSIRGWPDLGASFPGQRVLNRGFGGSQMSDLLVYFERLVVPYAPPLVVVYEGDNDLASAKSVAEAFADYRTFTARVEQRLPATEIAFLAVKPSPSRMAYWPKMAEFNQLLRSFCAGKPHLRYVDVATPMLDDDGQPRPELFQSDRLHMVAAGYEVWAAVIAPVLIESPFLASRHVLIDFGAADQLTATGPAPLDPVNTWNNVSLDIGTVPDGRLEGLRTTDDAATAIELRVVRPFAGANESGLGAGLLYPGTAVQDSLYGHAEEFNGRPPLLPAIRLTGLDRGATYHFTFFASRGGVADNRESFYSVVGEQSRTAVLDAANNADRVAHVDGMVPDAEGGISIELSPGPANTSPQQFAYLSVLKIEERPSPTAVSLLEQPDDVTVESGQPAVFSAAATGSPPMTIQWFRDGTAISGATDWTYTIPMVAADMSGAKISAKVSNATTEIGTREAVLTVVPDITPPSPVQAVSADGVTIEIQFTEPLDATSLSPATQFSVHGGLVPVIAAGLEPDGRTVRLTLAHRVGGPVPIQLNGIRDVSGNEVASNTTVIVTAPVRQARSYLFDFGGGGSPTTTGAAPALDPANAWNNVTTVGFNPNGQINGLITVDGQSTGSSLHMLSRFNGANENGSVSSAAFPSNATRDSLFGNTEAFNGLSNVFPSFKLAGLPAGVAWDFEFYASRTGVGDNRETGYTVTGSTTGFGSLNVANNVNSSVRVVGIRPTVAGEITVSLAPTASNTNANHFTYLGVLLVQAVEPVGWLEVSRLTPTTLVLDWSGSALLEWSDGLGEDEWRAVTPAPAPPWFSDVSNHPFRFFRLRAP